jgi:hypothetical protein
VKGPFDRCALRISNLRSTVDCDRHLQVVSPLR